ncbi:MAG: prepilin-type N-terminal cleavage/methylation domain-containing protein [Candidatus Omnitrophica bacterium]|nr:prepilin-type N-terminal cleavage/methylation domain-containing protein [Candidatus Omnitrophota bacterium]
MRAFTVLELILVLIILGILMSLGVITFNKWAEREYEENMKVNLRVIQRALHDYKIRTGACSTDYKTLGIDNPETVDKFYSYQIECAPSIRISAVRKNNPQKCFQVGIIGEIKECESKF